MAVVQSTNPAFNKAESMEFAGTRTATYNGVVAKTGFLLLITAVTIALMTNLLGNPGDGNLSTYQSLVAIGGTFYFISFFFMLFSRGKVPKIMFIVYAFSMGTMLAGTIFWADVWAASYGYNNIILTAVLLTGAVVFTVLLLYMSGFLRASGRIVGFLGTVVAAMFIYVIFGIFMDLFFGTELLGAFASADGYVGIAFGLFMVVFASLFLVLDLERTTAIVESGAPSDFEWYAAFGLFTTILWIFIEILQLLIRIIAARNE